MAGKPKSAADQLRDLFATADHGDVGLMLSLAEQVLAECDRLFAVLASIDEIVYDRPSEVACYSVRFALLEIACDEPHPLLGIEFHGAYGKCTRLAGHPTDLHSVAGQRWHTTSPEPIGREQAKAADG